MKLQKFLNIVLAISLGAIVACAPIADSHELVNTFNPNDIQLRSVQNPAGSNVITLQMNTPGVTGFWDHVTGLGLSDEVTFAFPFTGRHTFTYHVSTPFIPANGNIMQREFITRTIDVDIDFIAEGSLAPQWVYLAGGEKRTWKVDVNAPNNGWFMSSLTNPFALWWSPANPPAVNNARVVFDLIGRPGFTLYPSATAEPIGNTSWFVTPDWSELRLVGDANIMGQTGGPGPARFPQVFEIYELTENQLVLHSIRNNAAGDIDHGWTWILIPED